MTPSSIWDVYASVLAESHFRYGHAMWYPEPTASGSPRKGDVGVFANGAFRRLFNAIELPSSSFSFAPLDYKDHPEDEIPDCLQDRVIGNSTVSSRSGGGSTSIDGTSAGVPVGAKVEYECKFSEAKSAVLLLERNGHLNAAPTNDKFRRYMKNNYHAWEKFAQEEGVYSKDSKIILVRGVVTTEGDWTMAACSSTSREQAAGISATVLSVGGVEAAHSSSFQIHPSVSHRSRTGLRVPAAPAPHTIFLPHYTLQKRRIPIFPRKIVASAGPHELPSPDRDNDDAPAVAGIVVDSGDGSDDDDNPRDTERKNPVDILLQWLLDNSDAEVAIACEGDLDSLFLETEHYPSDLRAWLESERPEIVVENGMVAVSMKAAVARERTAAIKRLMFSASQESSDAAPSGSGAQVDDDAMDDGLSGHDARTDPRVHLEDHPMDSELDTRRYPGPKTLLGEGTCLLGKDAALGGAEFNWPHLMLAEGAEEGTVSSMSLDPDGKLVVTGSDDSVVRVWNLATGQRLHRWAEHEDSVTAVAFSPTGKQIASGSADTSIFLWDLTSPTAAPSVPAHLEGHTADIHALAYCADGTRLASSSADLTVKLWNPISCELLHTLEHDAQPMHLAWTPDSKYVVTCADSSGMVWDATSGAQVAVMQGHTGVIWSMAVSHAGDRVITSAEDCSARIWDLQTGAELVQIHEHTAPISAIAWSPDDGEVVTGSHDAPIVTNDSLTGECRRVFDRDVEEVYSLAYSCDGKYVASAGSEVTVWTRGEGSMLAQWKGHQDKCTNATFLNGDRDLLTSSDDGSLRVWSVRDVLRIV